MYERERKKWSVPLVGHLRTLVGHHRTPPDSRTPPAHLTPDAPDICPRTHRTPRTYVPDMSSDTPSDTARTLLGHCRTHRTYRTARAQPLAVAIASPCDTYEVLHSSIALMISLSLLGTGTCSAAGGYHTWLCAVAESLRGFEITRHPALCETGRSGWVANGELHASLRSSSSLWHRPSSFARAPKSLRRFDGLDVVVVHAALGLQRLDHPDVPAMVGGGRTE